MKLISCHIENFGVLTDVDINFAEGLNSYYRENGIGKTTLAAFIRAMFYGFDNKLNKDFPERIHYFPFKGGNINYGGNLTFENKGKIFKIEGNFNIKSEKKDLIEVRDSSGNTINLDKKPGEYFFGIDHRSFTRTLFVSANDLDIESTDSINQKLGGFINDIDETKLNKKLADKIKELESTRKNSEGIIEKYNLEINALEQRMVEINKLAEVLPSKYENYASLKEEIRILNNKKDEAKNQEIVKAKYETLKRLQEIIVSDEKTKNDLEQKYPNGFPTEKELLELKELSGKANSFSTKLIDYKLSEDEQKKLINLENKYINNPLTKEEISVLRKEFTNKSQALKRKKEDKFSVDEDKELEKLTNNSLAELTLEKVAEYDKKVLDWLANSKHLSVNNDFIATNMLNIKNTFSVGRPTEEKLSTVASKIAEYESYNQKILAYNESLYNLPLNSKRNFKTFPIIMSLSGGILLVGGLGLTFINFTLGITLLSMGLVILVLSLFLGLKMNSNKTNSKSNSEMQKELLDLQTNKNIIANELRTFFATYRLASDNFKDNLERIKIDLETLTKYEEEELEKEMNLKVASTRQETLKEDIFNFYAKYACVSEDIATLPNLLKEKMAKFNNLQGKKVDFLNNQLREDKIITEADELIKAIFEKHHLPLPENFDDTVITNIEEEVEIYIFLKDKSRKYQFFYINWQENEQKIVDILTKYNLIKQENFYDQYLTISSDKTEYEKLLYNLENGNIALEKYKKENNLQGQKQEFNAIANDEDYEQEINELTLSLTTVDNDIKTIEEEITLIDDLKAEVNSLKEKQARSIERLKNLQFLQECFIEAETNLKEKYIGPMEKSFSKYANKINKELALNVKMDYSFNLKYDILGKDREYKHLSEGQKTCLALCMRLAMIENMYKEEKLFLVLDDPFVNLDEKNIKKCLSVLKELAEEIQIIYFCCHESRTLQNSY